MAKQGSESKGSENKASAGASAASPGTSAKTVASTTAAPQATVNLANLAPVDPLDDDHEGWAKNLQGNILNGHGRDHSVHVFVKLPEATKARKLIQELSLLVTSAHKQEKERSQFQSWGIPGRLFGNLFLSARGYGKLGHERAELDLAFAEAAESIRDVKSNFLDGMAAHAAADLGDPDITSWDKGFSGGDIDAMLLLADDDDAYLIRAARTLMDFLEQEGCQLVRVERGTALRTDSGEGIEHFGYVDGRSQPLFLKADFQSATGEAGPVLGPNGRIDAAKTRENIGASRGKAGGPIDIWNPFEPLKLVLLPDPLAKRDDCLGSYFVFRKLEQNVRDFTIAEQKLADALGLKDEERERAGAMAVGRFRDGTPLVLNRTDGFVPPKENNFRHDAAKDGSPDKEALKCPFQGHIRKTNPRGDIGVLTGGTITDEQERGRRIARRGIPYGTRNRHPDTFQTLDDLPSKSVGLLFMCFQASIRKQFAFMQRGWANNQGFLKPGVGIDPIIGQLDDEHATGKKVDKIDQTWTPEYGSAADPKTFFFGEFVRMKGGEFFFAPSIPYLRGLAEGKPSSPVLMALGGPRVTTV